MSIVEGVSQANRQGWQTHRASASQPKNWESSTGGGFSSGVGGGGGESGGMEIPRAPARVTRDDLDWVFPGIQGSSALTTSGSGMTLPKAPGSVIPPTSNGTETGSGNPNPKPNANANARMSPGIVAAGGFGPSASTTSSPNAAAAAAVLISSSSSSLGPPRPLKSALRSSRTPSPNPLLQNHNIQPSPSPPLPLTPPQMRRSMDQARTTTKSKGGDDDAERVGRSMSIKTGLQEAVGKDTDEVSVSSYETGHENPDEEEEEEEGLPPPPPPHDHPASDVSASSTSTQTPAVPARRKSVRVSLQPTFSPTPPAFDDDETHAPWGDKDGPTTMTTTTTTTKTGDETARWYWCGRGRRAGYVGGFE
jgi:hypothetical protein